ncbi:cytochrome P450 family protein [Tengunoibacter tsumagoiensis]|uniref:Cytochrome P450 n=1 Tax=Tengunoibacter tsumagoiensis TaxID=2014871 RepID=A0A402A9I7_9CHLR|nr:cytochrome P450 [Tengunoibacter tsumagoiensis]GCE15789.1 cytochrome P450 [Tengunoibacter tsumagoiensis]
MMSQSTEINLTSPLFKANPYPTFARLRVNDPIHQLPSSNGQNAWLFTRYQDVEALLRDERFVKDKQNVFPPQERVRPPASAADLMTMGMIDFDPPDHTRLRSLVNISFTPRLVEQWRGRVQELTNELIDAVEGHGKMDLIEEFAFPLPLQIILEMLGVPKEDSPLLHTWTKTLANALGDPVASQKAFEQLQLFYVYLLELIERKRKQPADDLVSHLIQAESEGQRLSERELVAMVFLLIVAGHDTTGNLIGNGILALLTHPEQMQLLKQDPTLIKTAIEEFLRYYSPFTLATLRWAREDVEYKEHLIHRGDSIVISLSSANRDEQTFIEPEQLNIARQENRHLAFGKGIHYCIGAPLARMKGQIAIATLLRRLPHLQLQVAPEELIWRPGSLILGVSSLPVLF